MGIVASMIDFLFPEDHHDGHYSGPARDSRTLSYCVVPHGDGITIAIGPNGQGSFPGGPTAGGWIPLASGPPYGVMYNNENGAVLNGVTKKFDGECHLTPVPAVVTSVPVQILTVVSELGKTGTENHGTTMGPGSAPAAHLARQTVSPGGLSSVIMVASTSSPTPITTPPTTMVTKHATTTTVHQKLSGRGISLPTNDQNSAFADVYVACLTVFTILWIVLGIRYGMKRRQKRQRARVALQELSYANE